MAEVVTSENRAEFMQARMRIEPEAPTPEAKPAETPAVAAEADPAPEPEEVQEPQDEPKQKSKLQERFSELTEKRRQAEEKAAAAEARAAAAEAKARELEGKTAPKAEPSDPDFGPKPEPKDYEDAFKYAEDLAEWSTKKALKENARLAKEEAQKAEAQKVVAGFQKRVEAVKAELPDYAEVLAAASHLSVSDAVRDAIIESDLGPKVLYHLATHEDIVEKLNSSSQSAALRMIGRLEAQFEKPAAKADPEPKPEPRPRPKLPDPITPIKAGGAGNDDRVDSSGQFTGSYAQFKALRAAGKLA